MRINKFLAESGVGSRRYCDELIKQGLVTVNGQVAKLGDDIDEFSDNIVADGNKVKKRTIVSYEYYMMNKPKGYVCTVKDDKDRKTVMDLLPKTNARIYPVGRLDYDSEGLLLFTNDGDLANRLTHPSSEIPKTYLVKIEGSLEENELARLRKGVLIDGKMTKKCKITIADENKEFTKYYVTVTEGRNREIRKLFLEAGKEVKFLKRVRIGDLYLSGLDRGEVRKLSKEEINYLKNL